MITRNRKSVLSTVTPATGGTQSNELQAAIKSVTSATTVGAVFLYSTKDDSDGGKWRSKCKGLSWFDEPTLPAGTAANQWNSATRSARSEFPAMALIVADNASPPTVTIYDLDDPAMPMWMVFDAGTHSNDLLRSVGAVSVFALNGRIFCCCDDGFGLAVANMAEDGGSLYTATADSGSYKGNIATRNEATGFNLGAYGVSIAGNTVNDVAATVLEGAEIGALGLPIPTVAVATDGGVSVIHPSGDVYNLTNANTQNDSRIVFFTDDGKLGLNYEQSGGVQNATFCGLINIPFADTTTAIGSSIWLEEYQDNRYPTGLACTTLTYTSASSEANAIAPMGKDGLALGYPDRLSIVKRNTGNDVEGAVAYITSAYNTGYMVGDIRGAWLANSSTDGAGATVHDRCVKGNDMTEQGTVTDGDVATDAELKYYTNWNSSNYLSLAYTSDLDFTNTMSVMFWVKDYGHSSDIYGIGTRSSTLSQSIYIDGGYDYRWTLSSDGSAEQIFEFPEAGGLGEWTFVCFTMNAGAVRGYKNGQNIAASNGTFTGNIFSQATDTEGLEIGKGPIGSGGSSGGKLSLFRISATAPTPKQIADIYAAEKPLFAANAKCLLAANQVNDLAYDTTSGLLHVASESTASSKSFRGLEAVESLTSDGSLGLAASKPLDHITASGGVVAGVGGETADADTSGCGVNLPSLDVRAELNEGESKIPDDGKLHFSGITTSNGGDVIAHIPIAEEENVTVNAHVTAKGYGADLGTHYANYILTEQFYRAAGGDVTSAVAEASIVSQESAAGLDATLGVDTSADTAKITVTGDASDRVVWAASVEVIRDTEKSYER